MRHIAGIPITLSLLFMEVAANVGLPMKVRDATLHVLRCLLDSFGD
jgi:regulator of sirC expression with transglutaminase-like and TPR domain